MNEYEVFDANGLTLPPLSETEAWFQALKPAEEFTLVGHFQGCACDDCKLAAAELTDLTVGYDD